MENIKIQIKKRDRDYGLLTWSATLDATIKDFFNKNENIYLFIKDKPKKRKVSYKYRRFSIGKSNIPTSSKFFVLRASKKGYELSFE